MPVPDSTAAVPTTVAVSTCGVGELSITRSSPAQSLSVSAREVVSVRSTRAPAGGSKTVPNVEGNAVTSVILQWTSARVEPAPPLMEAPVTINCGVPPCPRGTVPDAPALTTLETGSSLPANALITDRVAPAARDAQHAHTQERSRTQR